MPEDSAFDRCINDLSSTLELAEALERQLEQFHSSARRAGDNADHADEPRVA